MWSKLDSVLGWKSITIIGVVTVLLVTGAILYYNTEKNKVLLEKFNELHTICEFKITEINRWHDERLSEALFFPGEKTFIEQTIGLISKGNHKTTKKYFFETLTPIKENHLYDNIFIVNPEGEILFSLDSALIETDSVTLSGVRKVESENKIIYTDFYFCKVHKKIHYDIISPILNEKHILLAMMVFRIDPNDYLYPFIQSWPVPSKTAETLIFRKDGNSILFLNELRHRKATALKLKIPLSSIDVIAIKAIINGEGAIEGNDYRNVEVLGDVHRVIGTSWYLVAKIDKTEVYSGLQETAILISFITILSILLMGSGLVLVYKYRQGNIFKEMLLKDKNLAETQEEFRTTIYSIGDGVITTDTKGRVMRMNPVAEQLTGWKELEARGGKLEKIFLIINENSNRAVENPVQMVLDSGVVVGLANHTVLISKSGKKTPIADNGAPIISNTGETIGVVLVFRDQTAEREAERKLRESELKFSAVFHFSPVGIAISQLNDGKIIDANETFQEMSGYNRTELIGRNSVELNFWIDPEIHNQFLKRIRENENNGIVEAKFRTKSGELKYGMLAGEAINIGGDMCLLNVVQDITERKLAEETLRAREVLLNDMGRMAMIGGWEFDTVTLKGTWTEEIARIHEVNPADETGVELGVSFYRGEHRTIIENAIKEAIELGKPYDLELELITAKGNKKWIRTIGHPIKEGNRVAKVRGSFQDITERKINENNLRESEEKNKALVNAIPDLIFLLSKEGIFLDYRSSEGDKLHVQPEQFLKKHIYDVMPPDIAIVTQENLNKLFETRELQVYEYQLLSEGKIKCYESRLILSGEDKALAIVRDITIRRQAEENIRKLTRGIEQSPSTIVITDIDGNIEYVNPKFTEVTGYTFEEVKGLTPRILKSGEMPRKEYEELWATILNKREWRGEFQNKKKNGELYWELASISPVLDERGEITNFIAVKEDVTEQKRMMNELIEAKQKAEEMNRIKTYFYANMSHELRTPFVGIVGFAELLAETLEKPEEKEMAEAILKASKRLTDTLNKILNVTNIEFGKHELHLSGVDVFEKIENLRTLYSKAAEHQNTDIKTEFKCDKFLLKTDEKILDEILSNLINNAVKFTFDGIIKIIVEVVEEQDRDYLMIMVADTGVGIPEDKQEIIWEEFRQVSEGYGRSSEGTGLGLSIVKKYTELLNGKISLKSEINKGSIFTLELPLIVVMEEEKEVELETNNDERLPPDKSDGPLKILIVEDDIVSVDFIRKILSDRYEIDVANNAETAFELIQKNVYAALIVDINLGEGMNGVELAQKIRKVPDYRSMPIVAVTAYASNEDRGEFLEKGFSHYISKPFALKDLKKLLQDALN